MNTTSVRLLGAAMTGFALLAAQTLSAKDSAQVASFKQAFAKVSVLEMPATAATLTSQAADKDKAVVAEDAVRAAVGINPSATPAVVGAIAHSTPTVAPVAATVAASLQPKQLASITRAAAGGAPGQLKQTVAALCKQSPSQYNVIAISAAQSVPAAGKEILDGLVLGIPSLKSYIAEAGKAFVNSADPLPVAQIVSLTSSLVETDRHNMMVNGAQLGASTVDVLPVTGSSASKPAVIASAAPTPVHVQGPPSFGPPFTPLPPIVTEINPSDNSPEQPGGHNYTSP